MNNNRGLDIIIPVNIDANWFDIKEIESDIGFAKMQTLPAPTPRRRQFLRTNYTDQ